MDINIGKAALHCTSVLMGLYEIIDCREVVSFLIRWLSHEDVISYLYRGRKTICADTVITANEHRKIPS